MSNVTYIMRISRTTVDKLGIKMYDKVSAVVAELVANSYDADAELVTIKLPMNRWLATKRGGKIADRGFQIIVEDDGHGMTPNVINDFYLKVGSDPRKDPKRGPTSLGKKRPRMGRKGIGKLAPFGICKIIEVISSGGKKTKKGFETAHFILDLNNILEDTDIPYEPEKGDKDGTFNEKSGTIIILRNFNRRRTPNKDTFDRQLSRRFGIKLPDFVIKVQNSTATADEVQEWELGTLSLDIREDTKLDLKDLGKKTKVGVEGKEVLLPEITLSDNSVLPVTGWIAYSTQSYRNEEVAGIRIYARGKIVSTTRDFGIKSGFTGEFKMRSYLIGEIHADWIDEDEGEDLIRSDRQDILWDSERGNAFREWGHKILRIIARKSRSPMRQVARKKFFEKSNLVTEAKKRFADKRVIDAAIEVGNTIGSIASLDDLDDKAYVENLLELVLTVAPHKMLVDKLKEISEDEVEHPIELVIKLFNDAKVAELASLGQVASERIQSIERLFKFIEPSTTTSEHDLQKLLEDTPWLIDPQWTVLQSNKTFDTIRKSFELWFKKEHGKDIVTSAIDPGNKRPDFIMLHIGSNIEIVEIKNVDHVLSDEEFDRVSLYYTAMRSYVEENRSIKRLFPFIHVTIICDKIKLNEPSNKIAFDGMITQNILRHRTWLEVLTDTRNAHGDFLKFARPD